MNIGIITFDITVFSIFRFKIIFPVDIVITYVLLKGPAFIGMKVNMVPKIIVRETSNSFRLVFEAFYVERPELISTVENELVIEIIISLLPTTMRGCTLVTALSHRQFCNTITFRSRYGFWI